MLEDSGSTGLNTGKRRARLEEGGVLKRDKERTCDEGIVNYREENDRRGRHGKEQATQNGRRG